MFYNNFVVSNCPFQSIPCYKYDFFKVLHLEYNLWPNLIILKGKPKKIRGVFETFDSEIYDFNNQVQIDFPRPAREVETSNNNNIVDNNNNFVNNKFVNNNFDNNDNINFVNNHKYNSNKDYNNGNDNYNKYGLFKQKGE